jgi:hypothetical protein
MAGLIGRLVGDNRIFDESDYFLPRDFVDQFAEDIPTEEQPVPEGASQDADVPSSETLDDSSDQDKTGVPCANHWKAAATDDKKRMWAIFDETGIFASACRHGLILWIADMVRSGEL